MRDMHNADLCDNFGNLVHRASSLCQNECNGIIPDVPAPINPPIPDLVSLIEAYSNKMNKYELQGGANIAIQALRDVNGYLQTEEPWKKKGDEYAETRKIIIRCCLESIYVITHLLLPFIPEGATKVLKRLKTEPKSLVELSKSYCRSLQVGTQLEIGDVLYTKVLSDEEMIDKKGAALKKQESYVEAQKRKKEAKEKAIALSKDGQQQNNEEDINQPEFTKMDIRVGEIIKIWYHPDADKLFCEQIDLGNGEIREITSGLREYYTLDDMLHRKVLVVCNLKPSKIVGFTSNGMVLATKDTINNKVELIEPPSNTPIGERVYYSDDNDKKYEPLSAAQIKKKKVWENVAKELKTNHEGIATWSNKILKTSCGNCIAATIKDSPIS